MPIGAGFSSCGESIAGYGGVDQAPVQVQKILIDSRDGNAREGRKIDPRTGRYILNAFGQVQGMPGVQQLVLVRAKTLLNSSAVKGLGLAAPGGVITPATVRALKNDINLAMKDLIDAKLIEVLDVTVKQLPGSTTMLRYFRWRDLTASNGKSGDENIVHF